MTSHHIALAGVLPQTGLFNEEQRDLLLQLVRDLVQVPVSRFPDAPNDYIARGTDLLFFVSLPLFGLLNIPQPNGQGEVAPRSRPGICLRRGLFVIAFIPPGIVQSVRFTMP